MKKISTIALTALLVGSMAGGYTTLAQEETPEAISEKADDFTNYMNFTGVIKDIEKGENEIRVTIEGQDEIIMIMRLNEESFMFNSGTTEQIGVKDIKKGATIEAYYDKNKPMILIYPATVTPDLVIVKDEEIIGEVKVAKFDKSFLSLDGELKLNLGEDTVLLDQQGEVIEEKDLIGKELAVFYSITTRSLPPQTSPSKVIALDYETEEVPQISELEEIITSDHYMKNGVKMIPLRKVAEHLGYHVESQPKLRGALITNGNTSITVQRGVKIYGYNLSIRYCYFETAPELKDFKTYVPEEFLELLHQN